MVFSGNYKQCSLKNTVSPDTNEKKEFVEKIRIKLYEKNEDFSDEDGDNDIEEDP